MDNQNKNVNREGDVRTPKAQDARNLPRGNGAQAKGRAPQAPRTPQRATPAQRRVPSEQTGRASAVPAQAQGDTINVTRVNVGGNNTPSSETVQYTRPAKLEEVSAAGATKEVSSVGGDTVKMSAAPKTSENSKTTAKVKKKSEGQSEAGNTVLSIMKCMAYITAVLVISIIISVAVIFAANDIYGFVKSDDPVQITIPEGADFADVAKIFNDNKIIKYEWLFKLKEGNFSGEFEPGEYTISPRTSYSELIYIVKKKPPMGISWVTIPEGYTTDEIIELLVETGIGEKEKYVDVINNYDFDYWFVDELGEDWDKDGRIYRLDGYLFPDTYQFYNASSEVTVVKKLLSRFNQVFTESYRLRAEELGYSVDDILNIAALIEKEAGTAADYGNVSSVFHNRLKNSANYPYLESDATIAYAIQHETGKRPTLTGDEDDTYESPYNSYKEKGLVPGPIANPSNSAILAALNPSVTNYYFFVSSDTETYFSATLAEHQAAIAKVLSERGDKSSGN